MKRRILQILLLMSLYGLLVILWQAQYALGVGRPFVYSVF